jgi:hypothetical protein
MNLKKLWQKFWLTFFHEASVAEKTLFGFIAFALITLLLISLKHTFGFITSLNSPPEIDNHLRIGTYNIWNFNPIWGLFVLLIEGMILLYN